MVSSAPSPVASTSALRQPFLKGRVSMPTISPRTVRSVPALAATARTEARRPRIAVTRPKSDLSLGRLRPFSSSAVSGLSGFSNAMAPGVASPASTQTESDLSTSFISSLANERLNDPSAGPPRST